MAIQANQLISKADLKEYLHFEASDSSLDDFFDGVINACSDAVESFCNTKIKSASVTEKLSGTGGRKLYLSNKPVTAISSFKYWDGSAFTAYYTSDEISRYLVLSGHALYNRVDNFPEGVFNFEISYTCGYSAVPGDLQLLAKELCTIIYNNSPLGDSRIGLISNQQGNYKMFFLDILPLHVHVIDKYRLINV